MKTKHTPEPSDFLEPWTAESGGDIRNREDQFVTHPYEEVRGVLRRIVACVNACAGLSTEALESGALADLVAAARFYGPVQVAQALAKLEAHDDE